MAAMAQAFVRIPDLIRVPGVIRGLAAHFRDRIRPHLTYLRNLCNLWIGLDLPFQR